MLHSGYIRVKNTHNYKIPLIPAFFFSIEEYAALIDNCRAIPVYLIHKFDMELQMCR